jgi:hypothetical protein
MYQKWAIPTRLPKYRIGAKPWKFKNSSSFPKILEKSIP